MADTLPYERQAGESPEAFHAFRTYRDLGHDRSLTRVEAILRDEKRAREGSVIRVVSNDPGKAPARPQKSGKTGKWCREHRWVERCEAWDRYVDERLRLRNIDQIEKMALRQAQQAELVSNVLIRPAVALAELLQNPDKLADVAGVSDPMAPFAKLITADGMGPLWELTNEIAKRMPRLHEAERLARGVRVHDVKQGPTQGGTAVWEVEVYQPPREGGDIDFSQLAAEERPEWDGDRARGRHDEDE